jgi:hypothetical protein
MILIIRVKRDCIVTDMAASFVLFPQERVLKDRKFASILRMPEERFLGLFQKRDAVGVRRYSV